MIANEYVSVSSTGNTKAYIYDNTSGGWVKGSAGDYKNDLYLDSTHNYSVYVYGYTTGENYSTTVAVSGPGVGACVNVSVSEVAVTLVTVPAPDESATTLFAGVAASKPAPLIVSVFAIAWSEPVVGVTVA